MGIDYNSYIGPYLRVTENVIKKQEDSCATHDFPEDAKFCPKCGRSKKDRVRTYDVADAPEHWKEDFKKHGKSVEFWDYLTSTSFMSSPEIKTKGGKRTRTYLYIPNRHYVRSWECQVYHSEDEVSFDGLDIQAVKKKFEELFKDEIAYLKNWFEVEVKFGYIAYCS